jgi:hypothetical protein
MPPESFRLMQFFLSLNVYHKRLPLAIHPQTTGARNSGSSGGYHRDPGEYSCRLQCRPDSGSDYQQEGGSLAFHCFLKFTVEILQNLL